MDSELVYIYGVILACASAVSQFTISGDNLRFLNGYGTLPLLIGALFAFIVTKVWRATSRDVLMSAISVGNLEQVDFLLSSVSSIDGRDRFGLTPWMSAKVYGYNDIAEHLKKRGADTTIPMPTVDCMADDMIDKVKRREKCAVVCVMTKGDQTLFQRAVGYADIKEKRRANMDLKFPVFTITQQFVAAAILKLEEMDKLSIEDPLATFIPQFHTDHTKAVTLKHLLSHKSGIHDYRSFAFHRRHGLDATKPIDVAALIISLAGEPLDFEPGHTYCYSASNYLILGRIIEQLMNDTLQQVLRNLFFGPLGLKSTGIWNEEISLDNFAKDTLKARSAEPGINHLRCIRVGGDCSMYSNARDLLRWNKAVFGGKVVDLKTLKKLLSPPMKRTGLTARHCFGWYVFPRWESRSLGIIQSVGTGLSYDVRLAYMPDHDVTVLVLTNGPAEKRLIIKPLVQRIFYGALMPRADVRSMSVRSFSPMVKLFEGSYDFGPEDGVFHIMYEVGRFYGEGRILEGKAMLIPVEGGKKLACRQPYPLLTFEVKAVDENGRATLLEASKSFRVSCEGKRCEDVQIVESTLRKYTGTYETSLSIRIRHGKLHGKHKERDFSLRPVSQSKFAVADRHVAVCSIEFVQNDNQEFDKVIVRNRSCQCTLLRV